MEDGCAADLSQLERHTRAEVGPPMGAMAGQAHVWDLRELKDVVIPDGVERIGDRWFWGSGIESVAIPASVRKIGTEAFCRCEGLWSVVFVGESAMEEIGDRCFAGSGILEISLPKALKRLGTATFRDCGNLKTIFVEDGRNISLLKAEVPQSTEIVGDTKTVMFER